MKNIEKLLSSDFIIYIGTRLYDYSEKIQSEYLESRILKIIDKLSTIDRIDLPHTFMPFRDINEDKIISDDRSRIIFENDMKLLNSDKILAFISIYNDISKDDGIAFEIGFLYAKHVPIFLLNTDFIWYHMLVGSNDDYVYDPIITVMSTEITHYYNIPDTNDVFLNRLIIGLENAFDLFGDKFESYLEKEYIEYSDNEIIEFNTRNKIFMDFGGCRCEYQRWFIRRILEQLSDLNADFYISERFSPSISIKNLEQRATNDLYELRRSDILVISAEDLEVDSGSAAMLGYAYAHNKTIILYYSGNIEIHGDGKQRMKKNLMIECACNYICNSIDEVASVLKRLI